VNENQRNPKTSELAAGGLTELLFSMAPVNGTGSTASMVAGLANF
jgi:hypothetical protein